MLNKNTCNGNDESANCTKRCESKVLEAQTLNECESKCYTPMGCKGPVVAKIPVVLSSVEIQIDVEAAIRLGREAFDIKTIDKHIFITRCKLVPYTHKLFIAGYVQKNIQFSTIDCADKNTISGKIQHTTVNVPFNCVTEIKLFKKPLYGKEGKQRFNVLDKSMLGIDTSEDSWVHFAKFEEEVFCELEAAKILETDIYNKHCTKKDSFIDEKGFNEIVEKMVINIKLKVLQNQKVFIPSYEGGIDIVESVPKDSLECKQVQSNDIELGHNHEKGIIAREVSYKEFEE